MTAADSNVEVTGLRMAGGAYKRGFYHRPFGQIALSNGEIKYVGEEDSKGFNAMCDYADRQGWDTTEMRKKLDHWVKTGEGFKFSLQP